MIEIIGESEIELTEICEDESLGLKYRSITTINAADIHRCSKTWYVLKDGGDDKREWGTRIIMMDFEEIIVAEEYKEVEAIRRQVKAGLTEIEKKIKEIVKNEKAPK